MAAGLLAAIVTAAIFGVLALRTTGALFLMATMVLAQVLWGVYYRWRSVTGGRWGVNRWISASQFSLWDTTNFYYFSRTHAPALGALNVLFGHPLVTRFRGYASESAHAGAGVYNTWWYGVRRFRSGRGVRWVAGLLRHAATLLIRRN